MRNGWLDYWGRVLGTYCYEVPDASILCELRLFVILEERISSRDHHLLCGRPDSEGFDCEHRMNWEAR